MASTGPDPRSTPLEPRQTAGLHHAGWTRFLLVCLRLLPQWLCVALTSPVALVIYLLAHEPRRALRQNLEAMQPTEGPLIWWWRGYLVFRQFGLTYLDRLLHMHLGHKVAWTVRGQPHFDALRHEPGGALVFTIHSGNYDLGASLFASKLDRSLHTVRVPEQTGALQAIRAKELADQERLYPGLKVHYNESANHLGLELMRLLREGEIVAIQGDRVLMDVSEVEATAGPLCYRLPRGPLVLAEMTRVPCYPIFLRRQGVMAYEVVMGPPFTQRGERVRAGDVSARWVAIMSAHLEQHWDQWFVFEPLVSRHSSKNGGDRR
jgi:predicted LPLAT superfamily acyltransferase